MSGSAYDWSLNPDDNQTADADINWLENMLPGAVNGSARQVMGRIAELRDDLGGALTPTGTANALTITANSAFTAYQQGLRLVIKAASTNTGAVTANVNGLGSKAIRKLGSSADVALVAGDIVANGIFVLHYSTAANSAAGAWILINPVLAFAAVALSGSASDLTTGTLPDGRFPATLPGASGANLTALNGSNIASGTVADARLPTTMAGKTLSSPTISAPTITNGSSSGMTLTTATITQPTLVLKQGAAPTPTAEGDIQWDTDEDLIVVGDGAAQRIFVPLPASVAAGDIFYATGAKVLARLPKGTTGQVLQMNPGATSPQWTTVPFTKAYESGQIALSMNSDTSVAHGLGVQPKLFAAALVCTTNEFHYVVGDEVQINVNMNSSSGTSGGISMYVNGTTNIGVHIGNAISMWDKNGGVFGVTPGSWKLVVRAWA